ncbi:hypothetical protein [Persicobacter diffluens]|uniref:Uncharacterized protein n=2 Tax=Persicobacter TaxID=59740 RepID=A0AAN4VYZ0_9BACT|nr:hypothetical protein PEDI_14870 [Persicobacter diffluens]
MHKILQHYRTIGLGLIGIFLALSPLKAQEFSMVTIENIRQIPPRYEVVDYATWIQINGSELVYRFKGKTKILQLDAEQMAHLAECLDQGRFSGVNKNWNKKGMPTFTRVSRKVNNMSEEWILEGMEGDGRSVDFFLEVLNNILPEEVELVVEQAVSL